MVVSKGHSRLSDAMAAEEGARARIAADIHDDTIQTLSAVALNLQIARDDTVDAGARAALDDASASRAVRRSAPPIGGISSHITPRHLCPGEQNRAGGRAHRLGE